MWLATLMGSDIIKEADDKKLIKKFICNKGLIDVMQDDTKSKAEVLKICGDDDDYKSPAMARVSHLASKVKAAGERWGKKTKESQNNGGFATRVLKPATDSTGSTDS